MATVELCMVVGGCVQGSYSAAGMLGTVASWQLSMFDGDQD
jgi:hypothetical protein